MTSDNKPRKSIEEAAEEFEKSAWRQSSYIDEPSASKSFERGAEFGFKLAIEMLRSDHLDSKSKIAPYGNMVANWLEEKFKENE